MSIHFPEIRVGRPIRHRALSIVPLFIGETRPVDYLLSDEAMKSSRVVVEEIGKAGHVFELMVENMGDVRVLFLEGEELIGAKQNRVLNTSILIPARSKIRIPVSCVEQGRWRFSSRSFDSAGTFSSAWLRYAIRSSVSRSVDTDRGHSADQSAVWQEVERQQAGLGVKSDTSAMFDTFSEYRSRIREYQEKIKAVEGCSGLAVAIGATLVSIDLFDKPSTCKRVWDRLLTGSVLQSLESDVDEAQIQPGLVEDLLRESSTASWKKCPAVGEGEEFRAKFRGRHGSALFFNDSPIHLSVLTGR